MSGNSSVGQASVYEAGDQRNHKASELDKSIPYEEGKVNSHDNLDSSMLHHTTRSSDCHLDGTLILICATRGRAFHRQPPGC
jgi:hypothetical protein